MEQRTIYYKDELNDEFSGTNITPRKIDENYKYIHKNPLWIILAFLFNILVFPVKVLYPKIRFHQKFIGKEKLKKYKKTGYFVYVNHTNNLADACIPSNAIFPKRNYMIANSDNVSMPFLENSVQMLKVIAIPDNVKGMKNYLEKIKMVIRKKNAITIYPEAHIWPYYTKIRPFTSVSFTYPVELGVPTFCMTNTYVRRGKSNKVDMVTYIDGPFFPDRILSKKEQKQDLRDQVFEQMDERSKNNNIEVIKYVKVKQEDAENFDDSQSESGEGKI
ncbi:MAG: 1-acyl-sn-glycerol-3-phosphate acyltransferase [Clostridia bacterium]|nr:1-acyl-sn-glycerol-3-phosphate acyltransferase [Clostridia bacterium]